MQHSSAGYEQQIVLFARRLVASWVVLLAASGVATAQAPRSETAAVALRSMAPPITYRVSRFHVVAQFPQVVLADSSNRAVMPGIGLVIGAVLGGIVGGVVSEATCEGSTRCNTLRDAGGGALIGGAIGLGFELMVRWVRNDPARKKAGA